MYNKTFELNLQLFAEGGAQGVSGTSAQSDSGVSQAQVVYGTQHSMSEEGSVTESQVETDAVIDENLDEEFAGLIKKEGKYSKQYQKEINKHLGERTKSLNKKLETAEKAHRDYTDSVNPLIESLAARYGVEPTDIQAIQKAMDGDGDFFEKAAMQNGMTSNEYKAKLENDRLQRQMLENHKREVANQRIQGWMNEAETLRETYPTFDLETELANPAFAALLHNGITMKNAYETLHLDEIMSNGFNQVAKTVENKVANSVRANKSRPVESAGSAQSASKVVKNRVSDLSDSDMDEIERRIQAGERITFRS